MKLLVVFAALAVPAVAHHSWVAEFDESKPVEVTGVVTRIAWENPHVWFYADVKDANGKVTSWGFGGGAPGQLMRRGITKSLLQPGMIIHVEGYRSRDGSNSASSSKVTFPDGRQACLDLLLRCQAAARGR